MRKGIRFYEMQTQKSMIAITFITVQFNGFKNLIIYSCSDIVLYIIALADNLGAPVKVQVKNATKQVSH